jgi:transposase-like protein
MTNSGHRQIEWEGGQSVARVLSNGKRLYTPQFKAWVIEQCGRPGVSLAGLALANGLNANLLRKWVVKHKTATPSPMQARLLPVRIAPTRAAAPLEGERGFIEVEIGGARVKLHGQVQAEQLRMVLAALAPRA